MTTNSSESTTAEEIYNKSIRATSIPEKRYLLQENIEQLFNAFDGNNLRQFANHYSTHKIVNPGVGELDMSRLTTELRLFFEYYNIDFPEFGGDLDTLDSLTSEDETEDTIRIDRQLVGALQKIYSGFLYMIAVNELTDVSTNFENALEDIGKSAEESELPTTPPEPDTISPGLQAKDIPNIYHVSVTLDATKLNTGIADDFVDANTVKSQDNHSTLQIEYSVHAPDKYEAYRNVVNIIGNKMQIGNSDADIRSTIQDKTVRLVTGESKADTTYEIEESNHGKNGRYYQLNDHPAIEAIIINEKDESVTIR